MVGREHTRDVEDGLVELDVVAQERADLVARVGGQDDDAVVLVGEAELALGEHHPVRDLAAELRLLQRGVGPGQERARIARELHDELGPDLTALNFNLTLINGNAKPEPGGRLAELLSDSGQLVDGLSGKLRNIISRLQPSLLSAYGVEAALRWYADLTARRTGMTIAVVTGDAVPRLPENLELALFRIAKEALVNTAKHAQASRVTVNLEVTDGAIRLCITDDGTGIDLAAVSTSGKERWGLRIMRMRTEMLGGTFHLDTSPGKGTRVYLEIPQEVTRAGQDTDS